MRRRGAFTLVEVLVSVMIVTISVSILFKLFVTTKDTNKKIQKESTTLANANWLQTLIHQDILNISNDIEIIKDSKEYTSFRLQPKNSIYSNEYPYISYIVSDTTLYRIESTTLDTTDKNIDIDAVGSYDKFKLYKKDKSILIMIKGKKRATKSLFFEL
jgi:type II secretory pathway pseudopilin PulG